MSTIGSKIRAAVGALGILACASPLAAQNHHRPMRLRYAAQYVGRGQIAFEQQRLGAPRGQMTPRGWRRGMVVAPAWRAPVWRRAWMARGPYWRARPAFVRPFPARRVHVRPWVRGARIRVRYRAL